MKNGRTIQHPRLEVNRFIVRSELPSEIRPTVEVSPRLLVPRNTPVALRTDDRQEAISTRRRCCFIQFVNRKHRLEQLGSVKRLTVGMLTSRDCPKNRDAHAFPASVRHVIRRRWDSISVVKVNQRTVCCRCRPHRRTRLYGCRFLVLVQSCEVQLMESKPSVTTV